MTNIQRVKCNLAFDKEQNEIKVSSRMLDCILIRLMFSGNCRNCVNCCASVFSWSFPFCLCVNASKTIYSSSTISTFIISSIVSLPAIFSYFLIDERTRTTKIHYIATFHCNFRFIFFPYFDISQSEFALLGTARKHCMYSTQCTCQLCCRCFKALCLLRRKQRDWKCE